MRVVKHWNMLPRDTMDSPSLEIFQTQVYKALSNLFSVDTL